MFQLMPARWLAALPVVLALSVSAQPVRPPAQAEPVQQAGPPAYRSAFEGYRAFSDEKVAPWKDSNDTVGKIGGWKAYAREAQEGQAGSQQTPAPEAPAPHSGRGRMH